MVLPPDPFTKICVGPDRCEIRTRSGETIVGARGRNSYDAIKRLRKLFDHLIEEKEKCSSTETNREPATAKESDTATTSEAESA